MRKVYTIPAPNGIVCFYADTAGTPWDEETIATNLSLLPISMQQNLRSFKSGKELQLSATGKLLLLQVLHHFHIEKVLTLDQLEEDQYKRPFFRNSPLDFNIAHSGDVVICAGSMKHKVGIDIEQIKTVNIDDFTDLFTLQELTQIHSAVNPQNEFFRLWTRKESLLKAIGMGVHLPPIILDTTTDSVFFEGKNYYLKEIFVRKGYCACVAVL